MKFINNSGKYVLPVSLVLKMDDEFNEMLEKYQKFIFTKSHYRYFLAKAIIEGRTLDKEEEDFLNKFDVKIEYTGLEMEFNLASEEDKKISKLYFALSDYLETDDSKYSGNRISDRLPYVSYKDDSTEDDYKELGIMIKKALLDIDLYLENLQVSQIKTSVEKSLEDYNFLAKPSRFPKNPLKAVEFMKTFNQKKKEWIQAFRFEHKYLSGEDLLELIIELSDFRLLLEDMPREPKSALKIILRDVNFGLEKSEEYLRSRFRLELMKFIDSEDSYTTMSELEQIFRDKVIDKSLVNTVHLLKIFKKDT